MSQRRPATRRDYRITLPPDAAWVEFAWAGSGAERLRCRVDSISTTGLAFVMDDGPGIDVDTILNAVTVEVAGAVVRGDLYVRSSRPLKGSRFEFGCLFYTATLDDATAWMGALRRRSTDETGDAPHFALRCSNCHSSVWVRVTARSHEDCSRCGQRYDFGSRHRLETFETLHERARRRAFELGVDLQSAVSILLGILTLGDVREILDDAPPVDPVALTPSASPSLWFDKDFQAAVDAGTLTEAQAAQRGGRDSFAKRLVARHRISLEDAFAVADNRTSLLEVLRKRKANKPIAAMKGPPSSPARLVAVVAVSAIVLMTGVSVIRQVDETLNAPAGEVEAPTARAGRWPASPGAASASGPPAAPDPAELPVESFARVKTGEGGEVVFVEATDPLNVLRAFCRSHEPEGRLVPLDVVPTAPPSEDARIGLLRDADETGEYRVVVIRRDPRTRRWFLGSAGDPDARVFTSPAPQWLEQAASESS